MKLLALTDLCLRWQYTRAGVHKLSHMQDFPKPITTVAQGRTKLFLESDILEYEKLKPGLFKNPILVSNGSKKPSVENKDWIFEP